MFESFLLQTIQKYKLKFIVSNNFSISQNVVREIFVHNDKAILSKKFFAGLLLKYSKNIAFI